MNNIIQANIHNRFDVEVIDAATGEIRQRAQAENIILDSLWSRIGTSYFSYIQYGTGTGTPTANRTSLFSYLGCSGASNSTSSLDLSRGVYSVKKNIELSETTAAGQTLTEVGISYDNYSNHLLTHAMLKDMNGNQITITKTNTDIIKIYATIFVHFNPNGYMNGSIKFCTSSGSGIISSSGSDSSLLSILSGIAAFSNGTAFFESGRGYGYDFDNRNYVSISLVNNAAERKITATASRLSAGSSNVGGFCQIKSSGVAFQVTDGEGWFPGTTVTGEAVGTGDGSTQDFDLMFPYADNATIFVDGVAQTSGVTVYKNPNAAHYGSEFNSVDSNGELFFGPKPTAGHYWSSYRTGDIFFENPHYATIGITKIHTPENSDYVRVSDDAVTWTLIGSSLSNVTPVAKQYQHKRFWKVSNSGTYNYNGLYIDETTLPKAVHFDTAPAEGAVITADYTARCIGKDINHVFDFSYTVQLGEQTE